MMTMMAMTRKVMPKVAVTVGVTAVMTWRRLKILRTSINDFWRTNLTGTRLNSTKTTTPKTATTTETDGQTQAGVTTVSAVASSGRGGC